MSSSNSAGDGHTTFDELCEPIDSFLEQHECDHPPHHRETLHFADFVKKIVYHFAKNCESGRQLVTDLETAPPELELGEVKRSTFFDAFQRFPVVWFANLLALLLAAVTWRAITELDALGKLYCVDGSLFPAIATMLWAEYTSTHKPAGIGSPPCATFCTSHSTVESCLLWVTTELEHRHTRL